MKFLPEILSALAAIALVLFGYWLSGAPWVRGESAVVAYLLSILASYVAACSCSVWINRDGS